LIVNEIEDDMDEDEDEDEEVGEGELVKPFEWGVTDASSSSSDATIREWPIVTNSSANK
jgi:hypothetical protein